MHLFTQNGRKEIRYRLRFVIVRFLSVIHALFRKGGQQSLNDVLNDVLNEDEKRLVRLIIAVPTATQIWYSRESSFSIAKIQRMMKKLQDEKIIKRVGSKKKGAWEVVGIHRNKKLF